MELGYVLHRWPFQETSLIVELFTAENGRIRTVAKGAKRAKSPWRGILQPFTLLELEYRGRGELQTLTRAEVSAPLLPLSGKMLFSGFYLNELIQRCTGPMQPADELFSAYQAALAELSQLSQSAPSAALEVALRRFEWALLEHLGHGFDWQACAHTAEPIQAQQRYGFIAESGFVQQADGPYLGADIIRCGDGYWDIEVPLSLLKAVMRQALRPHLGATPLKSRSLFSTGTGSIGTGQ
ncbi:DNA repair protein RecO [Pseudidiomarina taiwanensis]|uniref:DNA repair protein RecO n=1 Tax=Pseudidiomarina taiwanensis TaxID=337250 RepID=A0A432ZNJ9_9GAMM|nr:DNA repair protein RecO [Pseudidiomarina taiwanensis]RUO79460.1 DNA repair protein RecO [Pseudidiomarina taiwanensis]